MDTLTLPAPPSLAPIVSDRRAGSALRLEPLGVEHAGHYARSFRADPRTAALVRLPALRDPRATARWIRREARDGGWEPFALVHREVGLVGAASLVHRGPIGSFWFWIGAEHRRRGFGKLALDLLRRRAAELAGLRGLFALVLSCNTASRRVLEARGFREAHLDVLPRRARVLLYASEGLAGSASLRDDVDALLASCDATFRVAAPGGRGSR